VYSNKSLQFWLWIAAAASTESNTVAMQPDYKGPEVALVERIMQLQTLGADVFQASPSDDYPSFWETLYGGQLMGQVCLYDHP
jgi:hypothetical protein